MMWCSAMIGCGLGWTLLQKSWTLGLAQLWLLCMGPLRLLTKFGRARALDHLADGLHRVCCLGLQPL